MLDAGKLRHRIVIERPVNTQNSDTGAVDVSWQEFATVWAAIEPLSVREFIAAQAEQSKITARVVIRTLPGINAAMRISHLNKIYSIEGVLADKESGLEYMTLACSEGVRNG